MWSVFDVQILERDVLLTSDNFFKSYTDTLVGIPNNGLIGDKMEKKM